MSYVELAEQGYKLKYLDDLTDVESKEDMENVKLICFPKFRSKSKVEKAIKEYKEDITRNEFDVLRLLLKYTDVDIPNYSQGFRIMTLKIVQTIAKDLDMKVREVKDIILKLDNDKVIDLLMTKKLKSENFNRRFSFNKKGFKNVYDVTELYELDPEDDNTYIRTAPRDHVIIRK